jgi:Dockerin type I domain
LATTSLITVLPGPDPSVIEYRSGLDILLDAGPGFAFYSWNTGETTRVINVGPQPGRSYSVTVSYENGCSASDSYWAGDDCVLGDINFDGAISMSDLLLAVKAAMGTTALDDAALCRADVNQDGNVDFQDVQEIYWCVAFVCGELAGGPFLESCRAHENCQ